MNYLVSLKYHQMTLFLSELLLELKGQVYVCVGGSQIHLESRISSEKPALHGARGLGFKHVSILQVNQ